MTNYIICTKSNQPLATFLYGNTTLYLMLFLSMPFSFHTSVLYQT